MINMPDARKKELFIQLPAVDFYVILGELKIYEELVSLLPVLSSILELPFLLYQSVDLPFTLHLSESTIPLRILTSAGPSPSL